MTVRSPAPPSTCMTTAATAVLEPGGYAVGLPSATTFTVTVISSLSERLTRNTAARPSSASCVATASTNGTLPSSATAPGRT
jgi:hypothetical protein